MDNTITEYKNDIKELGHNPDDFTITKYGYYPNVDLSIREIAQEEDKDVRAEAEHNSAIGMFELLTLSSKNIKNIENEISKSDFEMLMMISNLSHQVKELEAEIKELKG